MGHVSWAVVLLLTSTCACAARVSQTAAIRGIAPGHSTGGDVDRFEVPEPTHSGYIDVNKTLDSAMFYTFFEAEEAENKDTAPIILWLQGGPGCSSLFGMLYINGPYFINEDDMTLRPNLGKWNRLYGLLYIEQPIGTGFSRVGKQKIPENELQVAEDLYNGLQSFYKKHSEFQRRPLIITGESYAGKYVPSIAHYILEADAIFNGYLDKIKHPRRINADVIEAPVFKLGGIAIGNGFTDAVTQTLVQAEIAWAMGLIDLAEKHEAERMQLEVVEKVRSKEWKSARNLSDELLAYITHRSGVAILEDVRRNLGYDGHEAVDAFLNMRDVKRALNAPESMEWISCSPEVDSKLSGDVMKSVKHLVIDILDFCPVLLYQGQFDAECGVASNDAWISTMAWHGHGGFAHAKRNLWEVNKRTAGYWKQFKTLSHVVIRNTGHMMPHDNPLYGQVMIEKWIEEEVEQRQYKRRITPDLERAALNPDEGQNANPDGYGPV